MFTKDILVADFEVTGFSIEKDDAVQLGFVVLDKETLKEKTSFSSWIKTDKELNEKLEGFAWATITEKDFPDILKTPSHKEVAKRVSEMLPDTFTFASWNVIFDYLFWKKLLAEVGIVPKTHSNLDLWTMAYIHLLDDPNYQGNFGSESVFQYFGFPPRKKHAGLEDARMEAEVLRKIMLKNEDGRQ